MSREQRIEAAARAVVDRWDSPLWKDLPHTGESINALRDALSTPAEPRTVEPLTDDELRAGFSEIDCKAMVTPDDIFFLIWRQAERTAARKWGLVLAGGEQG